jgi:hypothetical protein
VCTEIAPNRVSSEVPAICPSTPSAEIHLLQIEEGEVSSSVPRTIPCRSLTLKKWENFRCTGIATLPLRERWYFDSSRLSRHGGR